MTFNLHKQLEADTAHIGDLSLCRVLLMNNQLFPWFILVPRREGLREIFDCTDADCTQLMHEVRSVTRMVLAQTGAEKMNVATLGNMVPQLHIHVIARYARDKAWPAPVWNIQEKQPYDALELDNQRNLWRNHLQVT